MMTIAQEWGYKEKRKGKKKETKHEKKKETREKTENPSRFGYRRKKKRIHFVCSYIVLLRNPRIYKPLLKQVGDVGVDDVDKTREAAAPSMMMTPETRHTQTPKATWTTTLRRSRPPLPSS
jgi:hypothetical protein